MGKQKILLIDYDPTSIARLINPLTRAGFSVEVAKDGIEGLAAYNRLKPDLVLVEAMLPRKHGFEVCQEIKRGPDGERTAVMITTAVCRGRKYRTDALQIYGCDEYVEKPIPDEDLLSICRRLLSEISTIASARGDENAKRRSRSDVPVLDEMTDEEIESRLDSLLIDSDAPATVEPQVSAPAAPPRPEPSRPASKLPDLAQLSEDEIMDRLDALVDGAGTSEPAPEPSPPEIAVAVAEPVAVEPEPLILKPEPEEPEPAPREAEPVAVEPEPLILKPEPEEPEPAPREAEPVAPEPVPHDIPTPGRPSRAVWIAVAVAGLILAGVAVLGLTQSWFGNDATPAPRESPAPLATTPPPSFSSEKFRSRVQDAAAITAMLDAPATAPAEELEVVEIESPPRPTVKPSPPEPEVVEIKSRPVAPTPKPERTPTPFIEPDPEVAASLRAEILSPPVDGSSSEAERDLTEADPETLLGEPVRPVVLGELFDIDDVDSVPVAFDKPPPVYDAVSRRLRQQGTVVLNLLIDESGTVTEVELAGGIPKSRLNDAAIRAAWRWRYRPAEKDGMPVKVWKTERVIFKL